MKVIKEGELKFTFSSGCKAEKYDDWSFHLNQFQKVAGGSKAVDIICLANENCWLIEVKDYRFHQRTKVLDLSEEISLKVKDTLAGLVAAKMNANIAKEKNFAKKALQAKAIKVVLHLEQPSQKSRLRPKAIDPISVLQKLKQQLKAIDPHPIIVDRGNLTPNMTWEVE